jgi:hypothetical protein
MHLPGIDPWFFSCPACSLFTVPTVLSLTSYSACSLVTVPTVLSLTSYSACSLVRVPTVLSPTSYSACSLVTVPTVLSLTSYSGMSLKVSVALSCCLRKVVLHTHGCPVVPQMCFKEIAQYCVFVCCALHLC